MGRSSTASSLPNSSYHLPHIHLPGHHPKAPPPSRSSPTTTRLTRSGTAPPPPTGPNRQNSGQTRYVDMLLEMDTIPRLHTILSAFFTWILLAGFIIFPGTFTALGHVDDPSLSDSNAAKYFFKSVKNIPLLVIAGVCCGIGAAGMCWLWWTWRKNYVWLLNKIFLPGCLNSFAGLISTLINVYTQQQGIWNITAEVTAIVAGAIMGITALLFALYNFWVLGRVKRMHSRDIRGMNTARVDEEPAGLMEKLQQPALEPGSVV